MSTAPLVIDYATEGEARGYRFTTPTRGYSDEDLKIIWQRAMPRGQGWTQYVGARSLKSFGLPSGRIAVSQISVTDQQDESGRRGIRRAEVAVLSSRDYPAHLRDLWDGLSEGIQKDALFQWEYWRKLRLIDSHSARIRRTGQLVLTHPYTTMPDWQVLEGIALRAAMLPALISVLPSPFSWTTLALDYQDEGMLVAVPEQKLQQKREQKPAGFINSAKNVPVIITV